MLPIAILAGGLATRMRPMTEKIPKSMLEVCGRPFIDHQLQLLADHGADSVVICTGYLGEQVEDHVGDGAQFGLKVAYSSDWPDLLGTGGALKKAIPLLSDSFLVLYGDSYLEIDYEAVAQKFSGQNADALMTIYENNDSFEASNVLFEAGVIKVYSKKRRLPQMRHIDYGLTAVKASALMEENRTAFDLSEILETIAANKRLMAYPATERFYEIGSAAGLEALRAHLR